jgi:signal transduction histidine kinase
MQAGILLIIYVLTTISIQFGGFLVSRLVDYEWPTLGLMTFLILFMGAFGLAWPIAVWIAEAIIRRLGWVLETQQSGVDTRRDIARNRPAA